MSAAGEVTAFLPTLEMARAAKASATVRVWWTRRGVDLLAREPSKQRKLAGILGVVRLRQGELTSELLRYPYVPSMPFALEEGLAQLWERQTLEPPECLRVDIERRGSGDPYRGLPSGAPTFHGYEYGGALAAVRRKLAELRAAHPPDALEVRTFALPILWLGYGGLVRRELALVVRPDRVLHALVCKARWL